MDFLQQAIPAPNPMDSSDQIWKIKEFSTLAAMVGAFMFLFSFAANLLSTGYFKTLVRGVPVFKGYSTKGTWIVGAIIAAAIPALTFFPFQAWGTAWLPVNSFWPQSLTNGFVVWVLLNAVIGVVLFLVWHNVSNKKQGGNSYHYGISHSKDGFELDIRSIGKSALLAITTVGAFYLLTVLAHAAFLVDFRIWVMAFKPMNGSQFIIMVKYLAPFLLFFLVNGALLHGQMRLRESSTEGKTAWKWFFASVGINTLGIVVLLLMAYIPLFVNEEMDVAKSLLNIVAFQFVFINFLTALISTFFFRKTGSIFTGAFVNALLVTWYIISGQAVQFAGQEASVGSSVAIYIVSALVVLVTLVLKGKKGNDVQNQDTTVSN
ncbi:hypothetical protein ACOI1C_13610 [Bacillus sp. DJP31]|uniref:hypothetical protein n=1 Tax=Bacillus sp. DJP31 TaxID=3409789 RepID=UPI003BB79F8F